MNATEEEIERIRNNPWRPKLEIDPGTPPDEIYLRLDGKTVGKIVNIGTTTCSHATPTDQECLVCQE